MYSLRTITPPVIEPVTLGLAKLQVRCDTIDEDQLFSSYIAAARRYAEAYTNRAFLPQLLEFGLDRFPFQWRDRNRSFSYQSSSSVPAWIDGFTIRLPRPSCMSVASVGYIQPDGTVAQLDADAYLLDTAAEPARLTPANGFFWPADQFYQPGSVRVRYWAASYAVAATAGVVVPQGGSLSLPDDFAGGPVTLMASGTPPVAVPFAQNGQSIAVDPALAGSTLEIGYYAMAVPATVAQALLLLVAHWYRNREATSETLLQNIPMGVNALLDTERSYAAVFEA